MPDEPSTVYWDSCVFLHYIDGTPKWLPVLDALLEQASTTDDLVIVTLTLSITEVAFAQAERSGRALAPAVEAAIDALWADRSALRLVEFDPVIARATRTLLRATVASGRGLKPLDAIHLATAQHLRVADFHTTDDRLKTWTDALGFPIRDPWTPSPTLP